MPDLFYDDDEDSGRGLVSDLGKDYDEEQRAKQEQRAEFERQELQLKQELRAFLDTQLLCAKSEKTKAAAVTACNKFHALVVDFHTGTQSPESYQNRYKEILEAAKIGFEEERTWGQRFLDGILKLLTICGLAEFTKNSSDQNRFFKRAVTPTEEGFLNITNRYALPDIGEDGGYTTAAQATW